MRACDGFDLDTTVRVPAGAREHLERICRDALRPPIAQDRIRLTAEGNVLLELQHRWSDGTTHLRFHPMELLERLASLTARPSGSAVPRARSERFLKSRQDQAVGKIGCQLQILGLHLLLIVIAGVSDGHAPPSAASIFMSSGRGTDPSWTRRWLSSRNVLS